MVDYDEVLALAKEHRPKLIVCGGSAYPRTVETDKFREIADEVGALLLCDMAHFAGLVAAGLHPNPGRALRLRHLDDAQDARRPARRLHPLPRGARAGGRPRRLPGDAGRPARAHDRREGDVLQDRDDGRVPRVPVADPPQRRRARRDAAGGRARDPHRRHRHAPDADRPAQLRMDGQGRGGAAARGEDHRQPEHRPVRRAPADGRLRRPHRHAGDDDARLRRGRLPRGRPRSSPPRSATRRTSTACARASTRSAPRGRSIPASAATRRTPRERRRRRLTVVYASARPAQAQLSPRQGDADRPLPQARRTS